MTNPENIGDDYPSDYPPEDFRDEDYLDGLSIAPLTSFHPSTDANVVHSLRVISETLTEQEIYHAIEVTPDTPNTYSVVALDDAGKLNIGFVGLGADNTLSFAAYDRIRGSHDSLEGVPDENSRCWWRPADTDMMIMFLNGTVDEIMAEFRARESRV